MTRLVAYIVVIALSALAPTAALGQATSLAGTNALRAHSDAIAALINRVIPTVVQVVVTAYRPEETSSSFQPDRPVRRERSVGSGVVIDGAGYILTNAHVVEGAERVQVLLAHASASEGEPRAAGADSRLIDARIVGTADDLDLALLAVDTELSSALAIADYDAVRQGELVFAFGSPGALRNSATMGVVSAVAQQAEPGSPAVWIQTDAAVNPGNSGGPLVNVDGELIGINTFIRSMSGGSEGLGFAIPSAVIAIAYPQLRDFGHLHRAMLGISAQTITPQIKRGLNLPTDTGIIVSDVVPDGPAAAAGLHIGDVITAVDGQAVASMSVAQFYLRMLTLIDGQQVTLDVLRDSRQVTLTARAVVPAHECERQAPLDFQSNLVSQLGIIGSAIDRALGHLLLPLRFASGVLVLARVEEPDSAQTDLRRGDIVHAVNGELVSTPADLRVVLSKFQIGDAVVLQVERAGALTYIEYEAG